MASRHLGSAAIAVAALAAFVAGASAVEAAQPLPSSEASSSIKLPTRPGFVGRSGTSFTLGGKPFRVAGVNNHYLAFASHEEITRVLDDAKAMGVNVVRTFIQPVIGSPDGKMPTIWNWTSQAASSELGAKGRYVLYWDSQAGRMAFNDGEDGLARFDFVVAQAKKRQLKLIVAFMDFWDYTGGAQQVSAWYGSRDKYTFFAADPRTRRDYRNWVNHVLTRTNTLTGLAYKDEPAIMAWDLMNEPDIHPIPLLVSWVAEMSAYVKSIDPAHLVGSGRANIAEPFVELDVPALDFGTWHGYPTYQKMTNEAFGTLILRNCALSKEYGKPILLEEFAAPRTDPEQAGAYRTWLTAMAKDDACAGWVVWRLVSHQDDGHYPPDEHDGFDVHRDMSETWTVLRDAAHTK